MKRGMGLVSSTISLLFPKEIMYKSPFDFPLCPSNNTFIHPLIMPFQCQPKYIESLIQKIVPLPLKPNCLILTQCLSSVLITCVNEASRLKR